MAYPLITKKILKCVLQQCIHILNGCVHDECNMNVTTGQSYYRGTATLLDTYISRRGSSCVEAWHSVADRKVYASSIMGRKLFDARLHWHITNYNRQRLRNLGRSVLADGVAPSEGSRQFSTSFVEETSLLFGFGYYDYVTTDEVAAEVQDNILEAFDGDDALELLDEEDDDDDDTYTDSESDQSEGDGNAEDDDIIFEPIITGAVPEEVDFNDLKRFGGALGNDVEWTVVANPFAAEQPLKEDELKKALDEHPTFEQCDEHANALAAEAGMDIERHDFASVNAQTFKDSRKVNSRRSVSTRKQRGNDGQHVSPDFNNDMEEKFKEIWFGERNNPFQNAKMRDWCVYAMTEYEKWRMGEIDKALKEKTPLPPLCETSYPLVVKWAEKMKELSGMIIRNGAFNAESSQLCSQLKSFTPTSSPEKDLNIGETTAAADLSVTVVTAATASATTFSSPTTSTVRKRMDTMEPSKPKRKKADPPSEEELHRRKVAATVMANHGITADAVNAATTGKQTCKDCGLIMKGFYFNKEHGMSNKKDGVRHFTTRSREPNIKFCPLVDDHEIYYEHQRLCKQEKSQRNKRHHAENYNM
jgi:hypothetical protein